MNLGELYLHSVVEDFSDEEGVDRGGWSRGSLTTQQGESNGEQRFVRLLRNGTDVHLETDLPLEHGRRRASSFVFNSE